MRPLVVGFAIVLFGCPPAEKGEKKETSPTACTKVGQTCEYSAGKLGTCVQKDGCTEQGPACFVCQSQH
jgi:hypothetical protein